MLTQVFRTCFTRSVSFPGLSSLPPRSAFFNTVSIPFHQAANPSTLLYIAPKSTTARFSSLTASMSTASRSMRSIRERKIRLRRFFQLTAFRLMDTPWDTNGDFSLLVVGHFFRKFLCDLSNELVIKRYVASQKLHHLNRGGPLGTCSRFLCIPHRLA